MSYAVKLDGTGRVVLPSEIRKRLRLLPGSTLTVVVVGGRIELSPAPDSPPLQRRGKRLVIPATGEPYDAAADVRDQRDALARRGERR